MNDEEKEDVAMGYYVDAEQTLYDLLTSLTNKFSLTTNNIRTQGIGNSSISPPKDQLLEHAYNVCNPDILDVLLWIGRNAFCQGMRQRAHMCLRNAQKYFMKSDCHYQKQHPLHALILVQLANIRFAQKKIKEHTDQAESYMLSA